MPQGAEPGTAGMVGGLLRGLVLPLTGGGLLLRTRGARRWSIAPLALNVVVYVLVVMLFFWLVGKLNLPQAQWEFWGGTGAYLAGAVNSVLPVIKWLVVAPLIFAICYFSFTAVGMVIAAPLNEILSEKLENARTGSTGAGEVPLRLTMRAMLLGMLSAARFAGQQVLCALLCLPLLLIPVAGAAVLFLVMAYFAGLGFLDVAMGRNFLEHRHKLAAVRRYRWEVVGLGAAMQLLFMVPLAGLLLLPLGVAGGTLLYCRIDWRKLLEEEQLPAPEGFVPPCIAGERNA